MINAIAQRFRICKLPCIKLLPVVDPQWAGIGQGKPKIQQRRIEAVVAGQT
jgi:hypothetical protein